MGRDSTNTDRDTHRHGSRHDRHDRPHKHRTHRDRDKQDADQIEEEHRRERKRLKKEKKTDDARDLQVLDDDPSMWVEKSLDPTNAVANIPTADSLPLTSNPSGPKVSLPPSTAAGSEGRERDSWMLEPSVSSAIVPVPRDDVPHSAVKSAADTADGYGDGQPAVSNVDLFSSMGIEHKRKDPRSDRPDPSQLVVDDRFELNTQLLEGKNVDEYEVKEKKTTFGGPGYQWRMMKLKRLYEQAEEQSRPVEEVALERYGSLDEFNEALEERRYLDDREARRRSRGVSRPLGPGSDSSRPATPSGNSSGMRTPDAGRRFMFANRNAGEQTFGTGGGSGNRPGSRTGFRRPGEDLEQGATPASSAGRLDTLRRDNGGLGTPKLESGVRSGSSGVVPMKVGTPIPSVFTPTTLTRSFTGPPPPGPEHESSAVDPTSSKPPLSTEQLNKLQAAVLRSKLMDDPNASALEDEYEIERERSERAHAGVGAGAGLWEGNNEGMQGQLGRMDEKGNRIEVQVLPTLDARGKLYDVGTGKEDESVVRPGNRKQKDAKFETRDKEGNLLRYNADDDTQSLGELVRQERFGAGSSDQKNLDAEMARAIATDGKFEDDLDYMDDNADKLGRKKMKSDALKRAFAINDYARTKKALDTCPFCYQDDRPPQTAIVALGTRTYMCCTPYEELVPGHCLIVPLQHHLSMLEMEDDDWDEVRNFMKCLMRMHAQSNHGVIFFETITSFKSQRHSYIEAIPVPFHIFQDLPAYFRESILSSEGEWTQHKKLIDFSSRPGGFRRMMVPNLPYFMVQWDYKGEKGYGHVIEGIKDSGAGGGEDEEGHVGGAMSESEFPRYFAQEVIGNILGLEARKWRRPRKMDVALNKERARKLGTHFQPYNWTVGNGV
ncbi:cell cycle control protein cwf19 [Cryptococcus neoformans C23]|uniref:Cell cycle control protein cwf19 n=1 Tax=Cryptococcus neoformans (strain H99 / ATCC 208821 / CBS 10515 / FGSC 9487) TaxID=235443 RepID=J9VMV1_CRYN9|nr:cell cycle control protein cwf19 [Cryptococcus neoformans var. grubii H99]AUB24492.1 cell cycle control protein cwf19 [Cryptococcus neoformans var. grubii]OWZ32235.1 cell cycle control protein cwf19 [Cryptococcus neoformans var. grubii AD2-60a]OWZ44082.1 cell cycle control protein cwf19 [Cryptococcus neoformans var. grubii C23]OXC85045.1 cell cycle control protein cwf19 [Cryptococcus neoformans var. grubii AD1-7a]AFR94781.1 cell cycle control protein cwf19 [Cryptococcus neoformans var. grub|eukprot:XP_012049494.1 cell cycle control protein cwf19 [Cryptococcus neoformans var. grubii H99]